MRRRAVGVAVALGAALLAIALPARASDLPSFEAVRAGHRSSELIVQDRHGEALHRLRVDSGVRRGEWLRLQDISPALRTALVLSEDKRFYEHSGVDWSAVSAAAWGNLWSTRTRGASTLTMQLAGLLDEDLRAGRGGRSMVQKLGQAWAAKELEARWRKDQILEAYLNRVPLRGEIEGVDALARTHFAKAAHGLDLREAAITAALVRAPNASAAQVAQRACGVLQLMQAGEPCLGLDLFTEAALKRRAWAPSEGLAPHAAQRALREWQAARPGTPPPPSLRTTLDARAQRLAHSQLQRHLRELRQRHVEDGAVVVLDRAKGEVRAWVGSSGELSGAAEVDAVLAPRQAGSTLKPFLYAQAIAERRLSAASLLDDSPAQIATPGGLYIPQNYDRQFKGWVSVRTALGASLNVPAVRALGLVGPDAFARQLRRLGIDLREEGDYYGFSLALGSAEVSLLQLSNAYRALGNGGRFSAVAPLTVGVKPGATPPGVHTPALDPGAAFIVTDILADPNARSRTFGSGNVLQTRVWSAVKTGTSKDMRDNWAVGFGPRHVVGVWVGNAAGAPMREVSGTTGAAPVWAALIEALDGAAVRSAGPRASAPADGPAHPHIRPPPGVTRQRVQFADRLEASRDEWFLAGSEIARIERADQVAASRIVHPGNGTILALDPDIPPSAQRLQLRAEGTARHWRLNERPFSVGAHAQWAPWPGRHRFSLHDAAGVKVDEVMVEVRGAGVRAAGPSPATPSAPSRATASARPGEGAPAR